MYNINPNGKQMYMQTQEVTGSFGIVTLQTFCPSSTLHKILFLSCFLPVCMCVYVCARRPIDLEHACPTYIACLSLYIHSLKEIIMCSKVERWPNYLGNVYGCDYDDAYSTCHYE